MIILSAIFVFIIAFAFHAFIFHHTMNNWESTGPLDVIVSNVAIILLYILSAWLLVLGIIRLLAG